MQKAASSAVSSAIAVLLLKATISSSVCSRSTLCVLPVCHTEYSKAVSSKAEYTKYVQLPHGPSVNQPSPSDWMCSDTECSDRQYSLEWLPWFVGRRQPCSHHGFCTISANLKTVKKGKKPFSITMKIVLTLWTLWKGFRGPWGSTVHILRTAALGYLAQCLVLHNYFSTWLLKKC